VVALAAAAAAALCLSLASAYAGVRSCERSANPRVWTTLPIRGGVFSIPGQRGRWVWTEHRTASASWGQMIDLPRAGPAGPAEATGAASASTGAAVEPAADHPPSSWPWLAAYAAPADRYSVIDWAEVGWPLRFARAAHAAASPGRAGFTSVVIAGWERDGTAEDGSGVVGGETALAWAWPTAVSLPLLALNMLVWWVPMAGLVLAAEGLVALARRRRVARGRCRACGYDRSGIAQGAVCPECGSVA